MSDSHMSVTRVVHRAAEELHATRSIASETDWIAALNTFRAKVDIQIMSRTGFREPPPVRDRLLRKHDAVLEYLESRFHDYYQSYDYTAELPPIESVNDNRVWLCWWQGISNAPELVKRCIESIRSRAGKREVVVITDDNLRDYVEFPGWLVEKYRASLFSRTHLSDLLRMSLLSKYGGLWLDATFFCCGSLDKPLYNAPLFSIKRPGYLHASVAGGQFANYSIGCDIDSRRVYATILDYLTEYWRRSDFLIDYLLVDYLTVLAQRYDPYIGDSFLTVEPNNPCCDDLFKHLREPFEREKWEEISRDTDLFKLSWKQNYSVDIDGKRTFYGALIDGDLR